MNRYGSVLIGFDGQVLEFPGLREHQQKLIQKELQRNVMKRLELKDALEPFIHENTERFDSENESIVPDIRLLSNDCQFQSLLTGEAEESVPAATQGVHDNGSFSEHSKHTENVSSQTSV